MFKNIKNPQLFILIIGSLAIFWSFGANLILSFIQQYLPTLEDSIKPVLSLGFLATLIILFYDRIWCKFLWNTKNKAWVWLRDILYLFIFKKYPDLNGTWKGYYNASIFIGKTDKSIHNKIKNPNEIIPESLNQVGYEDSTQNLVLNVQTANDIKNPSADNQEKIAGWQRETTIKQNYDKILSIKTIFPNGNTTYSDSKLLFSEFANNVTNEETQIMLVYGYENTKNISSNKQAGGDRITKTQGVEMIKDLPKEQLEIYEINSEYMDIDSQNKGWVILVKQANKV